MFSDTDTDRLLQCVVREHYWIVLRNKNIENGTDQFYSIYRSDETELGWGRYPETGSVLRTTGVTEATTDQRAWEKLHGKLCSGYKLEQIQILGGKNEYGFSNTHILEWDRLRCVCLLLTIEGEFIMEITKDSLLKLYRDGVPVTSDVADQLVSL